MKALRTIVILLVLFGLPLGSWYFLKNGLEWRKDKLQALTEKGRFITTYDFSDAVKTDLFQYSAKKTTLFKLGRDMNEDDHAILDQFKKAYTFMFIILAEDPSNGAYYSSKIPLRYINPQSNFNTRNSELVGAAYVLVDQEGMIRQAYKANEYDDIVEDLSLVLPKRPEKDIEMQDKNPK